MRTLVIEHQRDTGAGVFGDVLAQRGPLTIWRPAEQSEPPLLGEYDALLVLGGSPHPVHDERHPWLGRERALLRDALDQGLPTLGICLGAELLAQAAGGTVTRMDDPEIGWYPVATTPAAAADPLGIALPGRFLAFEWHSYAVVAPADARTLAASDAAPQAWRLGPAAWAIQFHAEVSESIARFWVDDYEADSDPDPPGLDTTTLRSAIADHIDNWNALGNELASRFAELALRSAVA